jgi:serine/threonine protein phosphatase 1
MGSRQGGTLKPPPQYPPAPEGYTIYAVGDLHGRSDLLQSTHAAIDADDPGPGSRRKVEIYLGDYIDRGPDAAGVVSRLVARARVTQAIFLRGNHEQMLLDFLDGADCFDAWRALGGAATLQSYGVEQRMLVRGVASNELREAFFKKLPEEHVRFYAETGSYCEIGSYLMVHAGLRPGVKLANQTTEDLLTVRAAFLQFEGSFGHIVVHGHTPVAEPDLQPNRINIDTGAFATNRLTCLRIGEQGASILSP